VNRDDKAQRILTARGVRILAADEQSVVADVTGDHGIYRVTIYTEGRRTVRECSCPYSTEYHPIAVDCSHTRAVMYVWRPYPKE